MTMMRGGTYSFDNLKRHGILRLRVFLGIAQMAGVVCTITLLLRTGVSYGIARIRHGYLFADLSKCTDVWVTQGPPTLETLPKTWSGHPIS